MLKKLNENKELVKKLAKKYLFLASESLVKQTPRIRSPGLNKAGKSPSLLTPSENVVSRGREIHNQVPDEEGAMSDSGY